MANIVSKNKIAVHKSGGLHARMAESELLKDALPPSETKSPEGMEHRLALMLDCSGSMDGEPIKLLAQAVQDFIQKADFSNTALAIESFPSGTRFPLMTDKVILWMSCMSFDANGGTPMSSAMSFCLESYSMTRGLIISDGQPDSGESCKRVASQYKQKEIPLDCIHIGESSSGEELLKTLAEMTGGLYIKFKDTSSFATAFHFLLPETREQAATLFLTAGANEVKEAKP